MFRVLSFWGVIAGVVLFAGMAGCKDKNPDPPDPPDPPGPTVIGKASVWLTRGDEAKLFSREPDASIKDSNATSFPVITIDTTAVFQVIHGFGAALTGSSAYLIHRRMNETQRTETLRDLFDPEAGIGLSYLRLTMGASDFSLSDFTYDDLPAGQTDIELEHFNLSQDTLDVVPVLQEILAIHPEISLMGSPWSPPAWMKTSNSLRGGSLKPEYYNALARYFVKYIREMNHRGIPITTVTPQNEPLYSTAGYPCMDMQAEDQAEFIKNHLGPIFQTEGITTGIIIYDHNWDVPNYAISILNDPLAKQFVSGSAFHGYAGNVASMSTVHFAHPDRELHFTEVSGGDWATSFSENLMWYMTNILIGTVQNWSSSAMFWNLCLDQENGPQNNGCSNCRGVITFNTATGKVEKNEEYYALAHFSKGVRPGAVRIGFDKPAGLSNFGISAFLNPDGSKVLVAANYNSTDVAFSVSQGGKYFAYSLPGRSVVTFKW